MMARFKSISILLSFILLALMLIFHGVQSMGGMMYCLFILYALVLIYGFRNLTANIAYVMFLVSFYTFLMGRVTLGVFMDTSQIHELLGSGDFSKAAEIHIYLSLFVALLFIYYGYISKANDSKVQASCLIDRNEYETRKVRSTSLKLMYCTLPFNLLVVLERIWFVFTNGYFAYYLDFESKLPYLFTLIAFSYEYLLIFFLVTLPTKKEAKWPIIIYLLLGVVSLGTGQRGGFVLSILLVITYCFLRNIIEPNSEKWITKKHIIILASILPFFMGFLFAFSYIRTEREADTSFNFVLSFLYQQGVSVEVIGYGYDYESFFPPGRLYLLGDLIDYFRHNFIAQLFFGAGPVEPQSVNHALNDYAYDAALTYFVKPYDYLHGVGLGSCYIAEAWHDLGYIGVAIVSFVYGRILAYIPQWCKYSIWKASAAMLMYINILFAPRSRADKFVCVFISLVVIAIYLYLYVRSRPIKK